MLTKPSCLGPITPIYPRMPSVHSDPMRVAEAQQDMRVAYIGGSSGAIASALAWLVAGIVALQVSPRSAVVALFAGGAFIFPASVLLSRALGSTGAHSRANPLGALALEGTVFMLFCLPIAYVVSLYRTEWFFPAMLLIIGGRYLTFSTLYGIRVYWLFGAVLAVAAYALFVLGASPAIGAFTGAAIEGIFAIVLFAVARQKHVAPRSS